MLIAFDIGNTHIDLALFSDGVPLARDRMRTHGQPSNSEYAKQLMRFITTHANRQSVKQALIASVVRDMEADLSPLVINATSQPIPSTAVGTSA